jgi:hypothetical protein
VRRAGDDPLTTVRAEKAELDEIHLSPQLSPMGQLVAVRYPQTRVLIYTDAEWPQVGDNGQLVKVTAEVRFLVAVRAAGFGFCHVPDDALVTIARDACQAIRKGTPTGDIETTLFESAVRPTYPQVQTFVRCAITHFAPELEFAPDGVHFTRGITQLAAAARPMQQLSSRLGGS